MNAASAGDTWRRPGAAFLPTTPPDFAATLAVPKHTRQSGKVETGQVTGATRTGT